MREFMLILTVCNTVVVSQPRVDTLLSDASTSDQFPADKPTRSNGTLRSNDKLVTSHLYYLARGLR